jgi:hypothetical protein
MLKNGCIPVLIRASWNKMSLVHHKHICKDDDNYYEHLVIMSNNKGSLELEDALGLSISGSVSPDPGVRFDSTGEPQVGDSLHYSCHMFPSYTA